MPLKEDLEASIVDLQKALEEPALTPTARKRIQAQLDEALASLNSLTQGEVPDISLENQIAEKEREIAALRAQLPGYETHPDVWDEQGRLVSNVLLK